MLSGQTKRGPISIAAVMPPDFVVTCGVHVSLCANPSFQPRASHSRAVAIVPDPLSVRRAAEEARTLDRIAADPYRVRAPVVPADGTTAVGSTGFGAEDVAFGATGLAGFSANWLKQISLSFSSFEKRQSVTTLAGSGIGLGRSCGGRTVS
jgi:hypothetical protein